MSKVSGMDQVELINYALELENKVLDQQEDIIALTNRIESLASQLSVAKSALQLLEDLDTVKELGDG